MKIRKWCIRGQVQTFDTMFAETAAELWGKTLPEECFDYTVIVHEAAERFPEYTLRVYKTQDRVWVDRKKMSYK